MYAIRSYYEPGCVDTVETSLTTLALPEIGVISQQICANEDLRLINNIPVGNYEFEWSVQSRDLVFDYKSIASPTVSSLKGGVYSYNFV